MPRQPPPLIVTSGLLWRTTAALVEQLSTPAPGAALPDLLVWDERDEDDRWSGRPSTFVVRDRPLRARSARAAAAELRAYLWRRRRAPVLMVGSVALDAAPWLVHHRGRRAWLPTTDDRSALDAGAAIPPVEAGGPHVVVTTDLEMARSDRLRGDPRHRWAPGFQATAPREPARPEILAWGPIDRRQGVDLVGRALAARRDDLRRAGARVRWLVPPGSALSVGEADDLRRAGVEDLIVAQPADDPEQALRPALPGAAALLVCGRPGAWTAEDTTLWTAYRSGVRTVGFGPSPAPDLAVDSRWDLAAFGDVGAVADALVRAVQTVDRLPGPVGADALVRSLEEDEAGG